MKRILFLITDAGGGHRAVANALKAKIAEQNPSWKVEIVNFYKEIILDYDPTWRLFGIYSETIYNTLFKSKWTALLHPFITKLFIQYWKFFSTPKGIDILRKRISPYQSDLIVRLFPHSTDVLLKAVDTSYVTLITDFEQTFDEQWLHHSEAQHIGCHPLLEPLLPHNKIVKGLPLHPQFHSPYEGPLRGTILINCSRLGKKTLKKWIKEIDKTEKRYHLIILGTQQPLPSKHTTEWIDYTDEIASIFRRADIYIGKPGPTSISESAQMRVPIITFLSKTTPFQEQPVAHWVEEQKIGKILTNHNELPKAIDSFFTPSIYEDYKIALKKIVNRGSEEVIAIFKELLTDA